MIRKVLNKHMAEFWGVTERAIKTIKQKHNNKFELIELGSLCKLNNLKKEDLINLLELQELIKKINTNKQQTEN